VLTRTVVVPKRGIGVNGQPASVSARLRRRTGPRQFRPVTTSPRCVTSISCRSAMSAATVLTSSMCRRQPGPPITRAASDGQMVRSGSRCRASTAIAASARARRLSSSGSSHHGVPRSPKATFAACTRCRASRERSASPSRVAAATARRADINSSTSSFRSVPGIDGSLLLHRRPSIVIHRASSSTQLPYPDWPDARQVMVTPRIHTAAASSVDVSSSSIETPTARTAAFVDGHAVRAPTRWSSDA
jgi:hypothetical protein